MTLAQPDTAYDGEDGILCRPGGPRHHTTVGSYCAPLRCYCPGNALYRGPRLTVDGEPVLLPGQDPPPRDHALSQKARAAGERAARNADDVQTWNSKARAAVLALAGYGQPFTSEDVTERVGLPRIGVGTNRNNAVGALLSGAARRGVIVKTGRMVPSTRVSSHGAALTEWVGASRGKVQGQ